MAKCSIKRDLIPPATDSRTKTRQQAQRHGTQTVPAFPATGKKRRGEEPARLFLFGACRRKHATVQLVPLTRGVGFRENHRTRGHVPFRGRCNIYYFPMVIPPASAGFQARVPRTMRKYRFDRANRPVSTSVSTSFSTVGAPPTGCPAFMSRLFCLDNGRRGIPHPAGLPRCGGIRQASSMFLNDCRRWPSGKMVKAQTIHTLLIPSWDSCNPCRCVRPGAANSGRVGCPPRANSRTLSGVIATEA